MIDYPSGPNNFKYHSLDDLDRLIEDLQREINWLNEAGRGLSHHQKGLLAQDKQMLIDAEFEILERTLLGQEPH